MKQTLILVTVATILGIIGWLVMNDITGSMVGALVGLKPINDKIKQKKGKAKAHKELKEYELNQSVKKQKEADKIREEIHKEAEDVTPTPENKDKKRKTFTIR